MNRRIPCVLTIGLALVGCQAPRRPVSPATKLYWFIPDGMRADPDLIDVFRWANEGKLPNLRRLMERGAFGYSTPDFPSHTPVNFASLLTGVHPDRHGVADGPMHVEGAPLDRPSVKGFASTAKKAPPIWRRLEEAGKNVALISVPGSTPPELRRGLTVRGRWGGWGADIHSIVFQSGDGAEPRGRAARLFFQGQRLTENVVTRPAAGWKAKPPVASGRPPLEAELSAFGQPLFALLHGSVPAAFERIAFSFDREHVLFDLAPGVWSPWTKVTLRFQEVPYASNLRAKIIRLSPDGRFRIRVLYDALNRFVVDPPSATEKIEQGVGPMVDFPDNWPQQLVYDPGDKQTFLDEAHMALDWHARADRFIIEQYHPDVLIDDTYTPNQILESRWWLGALDRLRADYQPERAAQALGEVLDVYRGLDRIVGVLLDQADERTLVVVSSDHGVCPLRRLVRVNNLLAGAGLLRFTTDADGLTTIDWAHSRAVYLKMAHVYVHPDGLGGPWRRASGPAYEALRSQVLALFDGLRDEDGSRPVKRALPWRDAARLYRLPPDRIGDIVLEARPGYFWDEEIDAGRQLFATPLATGYKQGIDPSLSCLGTPFIVAGPGVRTGFRLPGRIQHVDQAPTLLRLLGLPIEAGASDGRVLDELLAR